MMLADARVPRATESGLTVRLTQDVSPGWASLAAAEPGTEQASKSVGPKVVMGSAARPHLLSVTHSCR